MTKAEAIDSVLAAVHKALDETVGPRRVEFEKSVYFQGKLQDLTEVLENIFEDYLALT